MSFVELQDTRSIYRKSIAFLIMSNKQSEIKVLKIPFTIASKIWNIGRPMTEDVKYL